MPIATATIPMNVGTVAPEPFLTPPSPASAQREGTRRPPGRLGTAGVRRRTVPRTQGTRGRTRRRPPAHRGRPSWRCPPFRPRPHRRARRPRSRAPSRVCGARDEGHERGEPDDRQHHRGRGEMETTRVLPTGPDTRRDVRGDRPPPRARRWRRVPRAKNVAPAARMEEVAPLHALGEGEPRQDAECESAKDWDAGQPGKGLQVAAPATVQPPAVSPDRAPRQRAVAAPARAGGAAPSRCACPGSSPRTAIDRPARHAVVRLDRHAADDREPNGGDAEREADPDQPSRRPLDRPERDTRELSRRRSRRARSCVIRGPTHEHDADRSRDSHAQSGARRDERRRPTRPAR